MGILSDRQIEKEIGIEPFAKGEKRPGKISYGVSSYGYDVRLGYKFRVFKPYPCTVIDPKNFDERMLEPVDLSPRQHKWSANAARNVRKCIECGSENKFGNVDGFNEWMKEQCGPDKPDHVVIPPHSFVLGESLETFKIPRDVLCVVVGKSTYARCGLIVNVTPGEPEWGGKWTIEISNTTPLPAKVYCGEGIMQAMFFRSDEKFAELVKNYLECHTVFDGAKVQKKLDAASCEVSYADKSGKYQNQTGVTNPKVEGK